MPKDVPHVATIKQGEDNTLVAYVQTSTFQPGQEVEVSVYLTQGDSYTAHYEKKLIPFSDDDPKEPAVLQVQLPKTELLTDQNVTVITRVAEVWPTVLQPDSATVKQYKVAMEEYPGQGLKAVWKYREPAGKAPGDPESPPPGNPDSTVTTLPPGSPTV